jgi:hypothetical protein
MAGKLVQINKAVGDGTSSSLTVTGINTDNVYMVAFHSLSTTTNNDVLKARVTTSGTPDSDSEYDRSLVYFSNTGVSANRYGSNVDHFQIVENADDDNGGGQGILYLYNFNDSSEFSFYTQETIGAVSNQNAGQIGGGVHTVQESNDGFSMYSNAGTNFKTGATLVLYKVV